MVGAFASRFDSRTRRHNLVKFVVGSHCCFERFSPGSAVFPCAKINPNISKFNFLKALHLGLDACLEKIKYSRETITHRYKSITNAAL